MTKAEKQIDKLYSEAVNLGLKEVERLARKALKKRPDLHEFCMAMGTASFTKKEVPRPENKESDWTPYYESLNEPVERVSKELDDFIQEYDCILKLTRHCMLFTVDSELETDW